uniref:Uncharacterized protein n=1 Tax=Timema monikensis TaxID=170555 RepID=A0A7R9E8J9_9NEOP|nr:unnamed protein product [Timema monikensis]
MNPDYILTPTSQSTLTKRNERKTPQAMQLLPRVRTDMLLIHLEHVLSPLSECQSITQDSLWLPHGLRRYAVDLTADDVEIEGSCESNPPSPEPATMGLDGAHHNHGHHFMANGHSNNNNSSSSPSSNGSMPGTPTHNHSGHASPDPGHGVMDAAKAAAHLNGTSE